MVDVTFGARVAARASQISIGRLVLLLVAATLFVPGFAAGLLWTGLRWAAAGVAEGFAAAQQVQPRRGRDT